MTSNPITSLVRSASPAQAQHGADWYPAMRRVLARIARRNGATLARTAAVAAITSPECQLVTNVRWTDRALRGETVGRYPARMMPAVRAALDAARPGATVRGPKVHPFYRAIMGDKDALVLDRWALRLATGDEATTPANREAARAVYIEASVTLGMPASIVQAIAWKVARDAMKRPDGTAVKLLDIHDIERDLDSVLGTC